MPGNPSQLSVVVTTSSPGFAWACLHAAGIDASRAAILTTPGASIGGLEDSLGRTLAAMVGLTQVQQILVLGHAADPVYRIGAEGLSERAERRGVRPTRAGWGDTIPYPRLAKNADRTVGRSVQAIASASWLPPQVSVVGIVVAEDGSCGTVALEASGGTANAEGRSGDAGPVEVVIDPASQAEPDRGTRKFDHSWLHDEPDSADEDGAPGTPDLFGRASGEATMGESPGGGPLGGAEVSTAGPVGASGPMTDGPTGGSGPLASGPTGGGGPLESGPTDGGGPLAMGSPANGGLWASGPRRGEGPLAGESTSVGGPLVNAASDGPLSSASLGAAGIAGLEQAGGGASTDSPSALETLPVTSVESLTATPIEEGTAPSGSGNVFDEPDLMDRWMAEGASDAGRRSSAAGSLGERPRQARIGASGSLSARRSSGSGRRADEDLEGRLERSAAILAQFVRERCYQHSLRRDMKHLIRTGASPETVMRNLLALVRDLGDDLPEVRAAYGTLEMAQSAVDRRTLETLLRTIVL